MKEVVEALRCVRDLKRLAARIQKRYPPKDGEIAWSLTTLEGWLKHLDEAPATEVESLELFRKVER